ncbi:dnaJ homolog subfamily B member 9-like isoform X1 [Micropterus dolomieu]|uniref:dnaJ homolog subfamily B member 9-like isoform X1 n=1 Tax=Micropterus dolomieu TaxID=147949 RepID=UPI001E8CC109|nr:dnaJ homolog subfamily B member 9-like isoform X1 [Micropterus dolomieu]
MHGFKCFILYRGSYVAKPRRPGMAVQGVFHWMQACVVLQLCLSEALPAAPETGRNYYDTLDVEPTATDIQIKKAFRKLAIKYHPDKNKSADAETTFREIAEAYKVLSNKGKRRLYDSTGHEAFLKDEASVDPEDEHETSFHFSFKDLFHDLDDSLFAEEPYFHWSFHQDGEDEDSPHGHYSFEDPVFSLYFGDGEENEEEYHY